jgi:cyclic pyranopterin phosphate synthase
LDVPALHRKPRPKPPYRSLWAPLRAPEGNDLLNAAIDEAISRKPKGHVFIVDRRHNKPAVSRHMSVTGG